MNGYSPSDDLKLQGQSAVTGVVTNRVISKEHSVTGQGSQHFVVKVKVSSVTNVGTQTLKLQTALGSDWVDSKSATFTAASDVYIKLMAEVAGDQTYLPLLNRVRMVLSQTNAGDIVTIDSVEFLQEL